MLDRPVAMKFFMIKKQFAQVVDRFARSRQLYKCKSDIHLLDYVI